MKILQSVIVVIKIHFSIKPTYPLVSGVTVMVLHSTSANV